MRIRPSTIPVLDPAKSITHGKAKTKALVDGRWTLAFRDDESCKSALSMIIEEIDLQSSEVKRRLKPLLNLEGDTDVPVTSLHPLNLEGDIDVSVTSLHPSEASSSTQIPSDSS